MDRDLWKKAGYKYDEGAPYYAKELDELVWDDSYEVVTPGVRSKDGEEYYQNKKWHPHTGMHIDPTNTCIFRRLRPGLVKIKIREE